MRIWPIIVLCASAIAAAPEQQVTIVYDNTAAHPDLKTDWGFSALVDFPGQRIFFDVGSKPDIFLGNLKQLGIEKAPYSPPSFRMNILLPNCRSSSAKTWPGPLPMVAAQQTFPSRDHRERYDKPFRAATIGHRFPPWAALGTGLHNASACPSATGLRDVSACPPATGFRDVSACPLTSTGLGNARGQSTGLRNARGQRTGLDNARRHR
jgi:hypothetical protein